jgi:hypothetical protein
MEAQSKYKRIAIWPGVFIGNDEKQIQEFENWALKEWGVKVKYLEDVLTFDKDVFGDPIEGKAGRNDLLFSVYEDDLEKFENVKKIAGIQWWADMLKIRTERGRYPKEVLDKYS